MPELPEVETVVRTLENQIKNEEISKVTITWPRIIDSNIQEFKEKLIHQHFRRFLRRGKYLLFELDDYILICHLRMEGKFFYTTNEEPINKHVHVIFYFTNGKELRYHDTRKFGRMELVGKHLDFDGFKGLGPEPWDSKLTEQYCKEYLKKRTVPIKQALLDQKFIAGIGNIYADEICFKMKVDPRKPCNKLTKQNRIDLIEATQEILEQAIKLGGTTIRSYTSSLGVTGRFQLEVNVHGRKGEPCQHCGTTIQKITVATRGTYFCPKCQKR